MSKKLLVISLVLALIAQSFFVFAEEISETFEGGDWSSQPAGTPLTPDSSKVINGWNLQKGDNANNKSFSLQPDPYHEGSTSLLVSRPGGWVSGGLLATKSFEPVNEDATVNLRITTPKTFDGRGHYFAVYSSDSKRVVNLGFDSAKTSFTGKDWIGRDLSIGQWSSNLGLYFDPGTLPNGNDVCALSKNSEGWLSYVQLEPININYYIWEERYVKFVFHFNNKNIDVYFDADPIIDQQPVATVPFADLTASDISNITFGGASGGIKGLYYDDISVKTTGETPVETIDYSISDASYTLIENSIDVKANLVKGTIGTGTVFAVAYNEAGRLVGISGNKLVTSDTLYESNFAVTDEVAKVKVFIFDDYLKISPLCNAVAATYIAPPPPPGPNKLDENFDSGEWVNYDAGVALNEVPIDPSKETFKRGADKTINGWVLQGQDYGGSKFQLMNDPSSTGGKGLLVLMSENPYYAASGITATKQLDPVSGVATFSYRYVTDNTNANTGRTHFLQLYDENKPIITFAGGYSGTDSNFTDWNGNPLAVGKWNNYWGFYFASAKPQTDIDKLALVDNKLPYILLGSRGMKQTCYMKFVLNFTTKTIDVYYDSNPITSSTAIKVTVPFVDSTASSANKLVIGGDYYGRGPLYWDDFILSGTAE